jgi:hypothetical protein
MERLPPEILEQVYYEMGVDWETYRKTWIVLGGVSRTIRASTMHIRWRNVSIIGSNQLFCFAALLQGTPDQLLVQNLFIGDTLNNPHSPADSNPSSLSFPNKTKRLQKNKPKRWTKFLGLKSKTATPNKRDFNSFTTDGELKTATYILAALSTTLRFLALDMASVSLAILRSVALPRLEAVSYQITEPINALLPHFTPETHRIRDRAPNLTRLHIVSAWTDLIDDLCRTLIGQLPGLAKLRVSTEFSSAISQSNSGALSRIIGHIRTNFVQIAIYDSDRKSPSDETRSKEIRGDHIHNLLQENGQVWYMREPPSFTFRSSFDDMHTLDGMRYLVFDDYRTKVDGKTWLRREQDLGVNVDRQDMPFLGDEL